jgi:hypothetical protein
MASILKCPVDHRLKWFYGCIDWDQNIECPYIFLSLIIMKISSTLINNEWADVQYNSIPAKRKAFYNMKVTIFDLGLNCPFLWKGTS